MRRRLELAVLGLLLATLVAGITHANQVVEWWAVRSCGGQAMYATQPMANGRVHWVLCRCQSSGDSGGIEVTC